MGYMEPPRSIQPVAALPRPCSSSSESLWRCPAGLYLTSGRLHDLLSMSVSISMEFLDFWLRAHHICIMQLKVDLEQAQASVLSFFKWKSVMCGRMPVASQCVLQTHHRQIAGVW